MGQRGGPAGPGQAAPDTSGKEGTAWGQRTDGTAFPDRAGATEESQPLETQPPGVPPPRPRLTERSRGRVRSASGGEGPGSDTGGFQEKRGFQSKRSPNRANNYKLADVRTRGLVGRYEANRPADPKHGSRV